MFHFKYTKPAQEIISKAKSKTEHLKKKIEERQARLVALRKEHEIDDAALIELLEAARREQKRGEVRMSFSYTKALSPSSAARAEASIGAGVVNNLLTESDFVSAERDEVKALELMIRNLKPIPRFAENGNPLPEEEFQLSAEELEYLGF